MSNETNSSASPHYNISVEWEGEGDLEHGGTLGGGDERIEDADQETNRTYTLSSEGGSASSFKEQKKGEDETKGADDAKKASFIRSIRPRHWIWIAVGAFFVIAAIVVPTSIVLVKKNDKNNDLVVENNDEQPPGSSQVNTPYRIEVFRQHLLSVDPTIGERIPQSNATGDVNRESSPQAQAFKWMIENDALDSLTPLSQVQRFVLSTFYFGTEISSTGEGQWMDPDKSECHWSIAHPYRNERWVISQCLETGELDELKIPAVNYKDSIIIPPELAILSSLRSFTMRNVNAPVPSPMPSVFGSLNKLTHLNLGEQYELSSLNFVGDMPVELAQLTELTHLSLGNSMDGTIISEIGNLNKLTHLELWGKLTGVLPASIGNLTNLTYLDIGHNDLEGPFPDEFFSLSNLEYLSMEHNKFNLSPGFGNLTSLKRLICSGNPLAGPLPTEMGALSRLEWLLMYGGVYGSRFSTEEAAPKGSIDSYLPEEWSGMAALESLTLEGQGVTGPLPASWGDGMKSLESLNLRANYITGTLPPEWSGMESLGSLSLENNDLSGTIPSEYGSLSNLDRLYLSHNKDINGTIPGIRSETLEISFVGTNITFLDGSIPSDFDGRCETTYDYEKRYGCKASWPELCFESWCP